MKKIEILEANNHAINVMSFRKALVRWGKENFRPFPWRLTTDPYRILIAEIMLHRTQVSQVVPVYENFIVSYPDIPSLAKAEAAELHSILYSLGLRWRIDLITEMASKLIEQFGGKVPQEIEALRTLPGVSDYVAGAVRCFAWNLSEPIIDTNTVRVTGRLFNLTIKDSSRRNSLFRRLISSLLDPVEPRTYNYALLDLAAKVCTKVRIPDCKSCPLLSYCAFGQKVISRTLPAKQGQE
jgi:A/G-specific adenine glycosylase